MTNEGLPFFRNSFGHVIVSLGVILFVSCKKREIQKPNIVFILADDFGIMDCNLYAKHFTNTPINKMFYETPNIDKLVSEGVAFDQAYANQLCSPTRASILTGKYAAKLGFTTATPLVKTYYNQGIPTPKGHYVHDAIYHGDDINIPQIWINGSTNTALPAGTPYDNGKNELTIAELLHDYTSAFIGKWHIGGHGAKGYTPSDQGFETLAWLDSGSSPYYNWKKIWNRNEKSSLPNIPQERLYRGYIGDSTVSEYLTEGLTDIAVNFICKQLKKKTNPSFYTFATLQFMRPIRPTMI